MTDELPTTPTRKATVAPAEIGAVMNLRGAPLSAAVEFATDAEALDAYEVQLATRGGGRAKGWQKPIWSHATGQPRFVSANGRAAGNGMTIVNRRPFIEVALDRPIDAYTWTLEQDGDVIEEHELSTSGIGDDGLTVGFRPEAKLRRTGRPGPARRKGVFYPPFDSHAADVAQSADSRVRFSALTHAAHVNEDAFAVDFNFGSGDDDRGHWVRAAAAGKVSKVVEDNGQVHIEHPLFDGKARYETIYAHMSDIQVKPLEWVSAQQRIGRIGSTYYGDSVISPHLHHQHRRKGEPIKMRLYVGGKVAPISISKADGGKRPQRESGTIAGWVQPNGLARARLSLRTRDAETQKMSRLQRLFFRIAARGQELPDEPYPASAEEAVDGAAPMIAITYDGPQLDPGDYSVRYRAVSDAGDETPWGYDHSLVVEQPLA